MKRNYSFFVIAGILIVLDQLTKTIFFNKHYDAILFKISFVKNTGISFGMLQGSNLAMIFVSVLVLILLFIFRNEFRKREIFLALIAAGTVGNLIDRFFRGFVVDFIDFGWFPVFNVADSCLTIGVIGFLVSVILSEIQKLQKKKKKFVDKKRNKQTKK